MMMPSLFGESFLDDWMMEPFGRDFFAPRRQVKRVAPMMKTDVRELEGSYELDIDLPGFKKEELQVQLDKGYLTIAASRAEGSQPQEGEGKYICRERYVGRCARRFYIGEAVKQEDIRAKFEDGILKVSVPKVDAKAVEQQKYIAIEG